MEINRNKLPFMKVKPGPLSKNDSISNEVPIITPIYK